MTDECMRPMNKRERPARNTRAGAEAMKRGGIEWVEVVLCTRNTGIVRRSRKYRGAVELDGHVERYSVKMTMALARDWRLDDLRSLAFVETVEQFRSIVTWPWIVEQLAAEGVLK